MVLQTVGLDGSGDAVFALCALRSTLTSRNGVSEAISSVVHLVVRPQKSAPQPEIFDPADLIDELVLLARVLLFIPDNSTSRFPVHIDSCGKVRNWEDCGSAFDCGHRLNLLFLKPYAFIRSFDQNGLMQSQFHYIASGKGRKRKSALRQLPEGNTFEGPSKNKSFKNE
jgi:hypothetical protein